MGSPQGRFADSAALLDGAVLLGAEAWGKHLFVEFPGERFVHVHLGLYGKFDVHAGVEDVPAARRAGPAAPGRPAPRRLVVRRPARRHGLRAGDPGGRDAVVERSGPDPIRPDADPMRAWARIRRSRAPIGGLLMDQTVLAGVGNVYRAEVLFRHRMHPLRPGNTLRVGQFDARCGTTWSVLMAEGVRTGRIDTVRPEHPPEAMGRAAARRRPRGRGLRLPPHRPALPRLREHGPHRGAPGQKPLLVSPMPAQVPVPRRTVIDPRTRTDDHDRSP